MSGKALEAKKQLTAAIRCVEVNKQLFAAELSGKALEAEKQLTAAIRCVELPLEVNK